MTGKPHANCKVCHVRMMEQKIEYKQTDSGKAAELRYKHSDVHREAAARYRAGDAGQANAERFVEHRTERRRASPAMRMDNAIMCASFGLISGERETSPTFVARTGFASEDDFLAAVKVTFAPGMTFDNYGVAWELDHKIPRDAYNFDDPEDVKRCWSAQNVHALTPTANQEKSWKLIDQYVSEAGIERFPASWNLKWPDNDFKIAHSAKMMARKTLDDEAGPEEQPSTSSGAGSSSDGLPMQLDAPDSDSD